MLKTGELKLKEKGLRLCTLLSQMNRHTIIGSYTVAYIQHGINWQLQKNYFTKEEVFLRPFIFDFTLRFQCYIALFYLSLISYLLTLMFHWRHIYWFYYIVSLKQFYLMLKN